MTHFTSNKTIFRAGSSIFSISVVVLSAACLFAVWQLAAQKIDSPLILPYPAETCRAFIRLCALSDFRSALLMTLYRSALAFAVSFMISLVLGFCAGMNIFAFYFLQFPISIIKTTPVVSFILLAAFWFSTNTVPMFVSVLMTFPIMTSAVCSGLRNTDKKLLEMADAYHFSWLSKIMNIYVPSVLPYLSGSMGSTFSQSWKVVVAAEVLGLPRHAAGTLLHSAKTHLETADVFAVSIALILLSFFCEKTAVLMCRFFLFVKKHAERRN
ncbi:MAG: ABC transporter permease subunit [Bacteroides sp.]|nr:ABC transporter permease subunit [Prevotella sp.]MCM1408235.1 ABC transporter permease subunit [Treponema brennaborense]MCM1469559.1 ABC transporter permease subunit [Bacteroides sp.]